MKAELLLVVSVETALEVQKKTPALTLAQARVLVAAVLELDKLTPEARLLIAAYHNRRTYISERASRKGDAAKVS